MVDKASSPNIGFRISDVYFEELSERARRSGLSVHSLARYLVIQAIEESLLHSVVEEVRGLRARLEELVEPHAE